MAVSSDSQPRRRNKAVSAKSLTSRGYAICFFPEQPIRKIIDVQDRGIGDDSVALVEQLIEAKFVQQLEAPILPKKPELIRLHWKNRFLYLISFISFTLSLNNVYHFPANVYIYGTSFLTSYTILMVFIGYPLHMMQVFLGQFCQQGLIRIWQCAPICCGISLSMILISCLISTYYNLFAAYSLVYFSKSFLISLPWTKCPDEVLCGNKTLVAKYYFYNVLLNSSYSQNNLGTGNIKWWLIFSNFYAWLVIYVVTVSGIKSIEKFAIFVVTFSYGTILLLFGLALQIKNLDHFDCLPDVTSSIVNLEMWGVAAVQIILELGLSYGVPICYGSYCHYSNWFHVDSLTICTINYFNSIIFFIIFYKFLSFNAAKCSDLQWIIKNDGLAMVYIVFSHTFAQLNNGRFFCLCFFLTFFLCIVSTQVGISETLLCAVVDMFPHFNRNIFNKILCLLFFFVSLVFCFSNGFFEISVLYNIVNLGGGVLIVFWFTLAIVLVYGLNNLFDNIGFMLNKTWNSFVKLYFCLTFLFISLSVIFFFSTWELSRFKHPGVKFHAAWVFFGLVLFLIIFTAAIRSIYCFWKKQKILASSESWKSGNKIRNSREKALTKKYSAGYFWSWFY